MGSTKTGALGSARCRLSTLGGRVQQDRVATLPQPQPLQSRSQSQASETPASEQSSGAELQGEGNYDAARRHRQSVKDFVQSGQVETAARRAAPHDDAQARELEAAEEAGKSHAKGEDPALQRARDRRG
ncbi:MAG: hypothetical protein ABIQ29_05550 [Burkholderiaceae bacterium]